MKFNINSKNFYFAIENIAKYWINKERLPLSNLINLCLYKDSLTVANTDGYKLFCETFTTTDANCDFELNYSIKIDKDKIKKIKTKNENIEIEIKENTISINNIDFELIEFRYPDYHTIISIFNENCNLIKVNKKEFVNALDTISQVSSNKIDTIKLELTKNSLKLHQNENLILNYECLVNDYQVLSIIENKDIDRILFNNEYLSIVLKSFLEDYVYIAFTDHLFPTYIAGNIDNLKNRKNFRLLMPLRW